MPNIRIEDVGITHPFEVDRIHSERSYMQSVRFQSVSCDCHELTEKQLIFIVVMLVAWMQMLDAYEQIVHTNTSYHAICKHAHSHNWTSDAGSSEIGIIAIFSDNGSYYWCSVGSTGPGSRCEKLICFQYCMICLFLIVISYAARYWMAYIVSTFNFNKIMLFIVRHYYTCIQNVLDSYKGDYVTWTCVVICVTL